MIFGNHLGCLECFQNIIRNISPSHVMSEESCAISRAFNRQLRVPRSPHCITKERRSGAKHRKTYDLCMSSHFGKVTRSRSGHKYYRNHWWCELLPSGSKLYFCLQPEKTDPMNGAKSQLGQYHVLLITSPTAEFQFHWNIPRPRGCDGRPISIMLQDDGMTFRVWREHEDGLFSCTIKRA